MTDPVYHKLKESAFEYTAGNFSRQTLKCLHYHVLNDSCSGANYQVFFFVVEIYRRMSKMTCSCQIVLSVSNTD